jgi:hypothetical protein
MNRNLGIERVFNLGDYKSLRVIDYINDLPEELAMNLDAISLIRYLQLVDVDLVLAKHGQLTKQKAMLSNESEVESFLLTEQANTMEQLKDLIKTLKGE